MAQNERSGIAKLNYHEEQFARSFIVPEKRARYLSLLESKHGRDKLLDGLNHCHDLDSRFSELIPANQQTAQSIERLLKSKGAPDVCYVMSSNPDIDNREMPLSEALTETVGMDAGTLISCIAGRLAYFELEGFDGRYILER
ncbi:MAG TPA: hypothetical protein VF543_05925 [Pyrinomonadaceae bacterium]